MAKKIEHLTKEETATEAKPPAPGLAIPDGRPSQEGLRQGGMTTFPAGAQLGDVVGIPGVVRVGGGFKKGFDPRRHVGRKRGSKNRPKTEAPYKCPYCYKPIGRVRERRGLTKARIPDRLRQLQRRKKHEGQPRRGRLRFERGFDAARCLTGRSIGRPNSHPRVPPYCKHCHRRIGREWAKVLIRRWHSRQP
jgi:hypothetical protein